MKIKIKGLFLLLSFLLSTLAGFSQSVVEVTGQIKEAGSREGVFAVNLVFYSLPDSVMVGYSTTDGDGNFSVILPRPGDFFLRATFVGFRDLEKNFQAGSGGASLGVLFMETKAELLKEVEVVEFQERSRQRGDTTEYNARAFKTQPDASAEDLIKKMPGITEEGGAIKAQGEEVRRVLVDGKPFFGDNPRTSLRNIPSQAVDRIEVFDQASEQSRLSGFDDGQSVKTLNIVTKPDFRNGIFGRLSGGYGWENLYSGGGNLNYFEDEKRLTLLVMTNNVNQQNFSTQDLTGVGGGGGNSGRRRFMNQQSAASDPSDFMNSGQNGINTTHAAGLNYSDKFGQKLTLNMSYFFNQTKTDFDQLLTREFFLGENNSAFYRENQNSLSKSQNHRANFRMEWKIDSTNTLVFLPRVNYQKSESASFTDGNNSTGSTLLNTTQTRQDVAANAINAGSELIYRKSMAKKGRSMSLNFSNNYSNRESLRFLYSENRQIAGLTPENDTLDQRTEIENPGFDLGANMIYTEPAGKNGNLMFSHNANWNRSFNEQTTLRMDAPLGEHALRDTTLSSDFSASTLTNRSGLSYRYNKDKMNWMVNLSFQDARLFGEEFFPGDNRIERQFLNLLPMAMFRYQFNKETNYRFFYRSFTRLPGVNQLQEAVNNANPLLLSSGNPDLAQEVSHRFGTRLSKSMPSKGQTLGTGVWGLFTQNYIGTATRIAAQDTVLFNNINLRKGSQFSRPENLKAYLNFRYYLDYGFPVAFLKSNLNLSSAIGWTKTPGLLNDKVSQTHNFNFSETMVLASNISERLDFSFTLTAAYNIVRSNIRPELNNNFYNQTAHLRFHWQFYKTLVARTDATHTLFYGLSDAFNRNFLLWNVGVGTKLFKNQRGELVFSIYDLLGQNDQIARTVSDIYVEDVRYNVLSRYYMLTFTWNFRTYKSTDLK